MSRETWTNPEVAYSVTSASKCDLPPKSAPQVIVNNEVFSSFIAAADASWPTFKKDPNRFIDRFIESKTIDWELVSAMRKHSQIASRTRSKQDGLEVLNGLMLLNKKNKGRKIKRQTAARICAEMLERIQEINSNPMYGCNVPLVVVFGSYIRPEVENVGDIDIAFLTTRRKHYTKRAEELGRIHHNLDYISRLYLADIEVSRQIRNRSSWISVHDWDELVDLKCPFKVIHAHGTYDQPTELLNGGAITADEFFEVVKRLQKHDQDVWAQQKETA